MTNLRTFPVAVVLVLLLAGCAGTGSAPALPTGAALRHENLNAVLWMRRSAEYRASVLGSFNQAERMLARALEDPGWDALPPPEREGLPLAGLPPAVIVDADETLIDNSLFQAELIRDDARYDPERWRLWTERRQALAIPGALRFAEAATARGVTVLYITNRRTPEEYQGTVDLLRALGFPLAEDASNLIALGDPRGPAVEKSARRRWAGERFRILLMLGDNLGDFLDQDGLDGATRTALMTPYREWWGERWFMLPNPSYGSWESALRRDCPPALADDPLACKHGLLGHE
jgi:5'-nucleotidase (lipoprotein e(P4) family)